LSKENLAVSQFISSDLDLAIAKMLLLRGIYGLKTFVNYNLVKYKRSALLGLVMLEGRT
jgi:hypothetical protein